MIDILPEHLAIVKNILTEIVPDIEVFAFGSRVTGPAKKHSDLDLLLKGKGIIDKAVMRKLKIAFEDSDLPFRVDVLDWASTKPNFREMIEKHAIIIKEVKKQ
ncbi:MAG: nucleotidyltransferase domain-containing protein [Desulfobacteraceae bacterium]|nr:MAG: nucleotidyltransferase domain-containing protein [Desulfobacteraceae bacterium]